MSSIIKVSSVISDSNLGKLEVKYTKESLLKSLLRNPSVLCFYDLTDLSKSVKDDKGNITGWVDSKNNILGKFIKISPESSEEYPEYSENVFKNETGCIEFKGEDRRILSVNSELFNEYTKEYTLATASLNKLGKNNDLSTVVAEAKSVKGFNAYFRGSVNSNIAGTFSGGLLSVLPTTKYANPTAITVTSNKLSKIGNLTINRDYSCVSLTDNNYNPEKGGINIGGSRSHQLFWGNIGHVLVMDTNIHSDTRFKELYYQYLNFVYGI